MPKVNIDNSTFQRLQGFTEPLVDTLDDVIHRALDALEKSDGYATGVTRGRGAAQAVPEIGRVLGDTAFSPVPGVPKPPRKLRVRSRQAESGERFIDPENLPRMTYSRVREAKVGGRRISAPSWNNLLVWLVVVARGKSIDIPEMRRLGVSRVVVGRKEDQGFVHYPEVNISVQGTDAMKACKGIVALAKRLGVALDIGVEWLARDEALYPGERGRLRLDASRRR